MKFNPEIHHCRSIRLKRYDYSQSGVYFITICVKNRDCLFGQIYNGIIVLNDAGKIAEKGFLNILDHFPQGKPDVFVVMPNHVHGIIIDASIFLIGKACHDADNIREAIDQVQPFGVDLCSGVRTAGHLDSKKLEAFFDAIGE